jgi:hypothetical protein
MTKKKKKLTPERKAYKKAQKEKFEWIFIGGKKRKFEEFILNTSIFIPKAQSSQTN